VGSPNVYYQGKAGGYDLRVVVRPPEAIPGRAEVTVTTDTPASRVTVLPAPADVSDTALPPADAAQRVSGAENVFSAEVWIMTEGSHALRIAVEGPQGEGRTVVPVNAVNLAPSPMPTWLKASLIVLGLLLAGGVAVIPGVMTREAGLLPGVLPTEARQKRGMTAGVAAGLAALFVLAGGWIVWQQTDRDYRNNRLYRQLPISATATLETGVRLLELERLPDERGSRAWPALSTDHGKLMHTFLIREPDLDIFAHVHPVPGRDDRFLSALPPLPGGTYRVYADITGENGLSQTLTASVVLPEAPTASAVPDSGEPVPDPDDSWRTGTGFAPPAALPIAVSELPGGYRMTWENPEAGRDRTQGELRFSVTDATGQSAVLEPYMGMMGHAAIRREDVAVFTHLHPTGSISMASQEILTPKEGGADSAVMDHSMHLGHGVQTNRIIFPYEFPQSGPYRIWVQIKTAGQVMTGIFDVEVQEAK